MIDPAWLYAVHPDPAITPGTTTPIADALHWAHLDFFITLGAATASLVQIVVVIRTLVQVTRGHRQQAELLRMQHSAYERQDEIFRALGLPGPGDRKK